MTKEDCIYYDDHFGFCKNKYDCNYRSDSGLCLYSNHIKIIAAKIREVRRLREIESADCTPYREKSIMEEGV